MYQSKSVTLPYVLAEVICRMRRTTSSRYAGDITAEEGEVVTPVEDSSFAFPRSEAIALGRAVAVVVGGTRCDNNCDTISRTLLRLTCENKMCRVSASWKVL